ncbi:Leucine-rich repeat-containing protein 74A [Exaiptasia diaphana]|nr:Leucine-rich repeat-containing protein 74A [Exaiptasia diaphana]
MSLNIPGTSRERSETIQRVDKTLRVLNSGGLRGHLGRGKLNANVTGAESDSESSDGDWDTDLEDNGPKNDYDATGRKMYLRACDKLGTVPASYFVRHMTEPEMTMMHHGLGPAGVEAISLALIYNTTITSLNIRDNGIGEAGGEIMAKLLRENYYITELDISDNQIGSKGCFEMSETLRINDTLTKLSMAGNELHDKDAQVLVQALRTNSTITYIDLSNNKLSNKSCEYFEELLDENCTLTYMDLSWNHIQVVGAKHLANGLSGNMKLKTLKLAWNGITNEGTVALSKALSDNRVLTELDLTSNRISDHSVFVLSRVLTNNNIMEVLLLAKNNISEEGACSILHAILKNTESKMSKIDLRGALIKDDFLALYNEVQSLKPEITIVTDHAPETRPRPETPNPGMLLRNYLAKEHVRIVDLFRKLDRDQSMQVSVREFVDGLRKSDVGLTTFEVEKMIECLDADNDGEIDYSEFVSIQNMWQKPDNMNLKNRRMSKRV